MAHLILFAHHKPDCAPLFLCLEAKNVIKKKGGSCWLLCCEGIQIFLCVWKTHGSWHESKNPCCDDGKRVPQQGVKEQDAADSGLPGGEKNQGIGSPLPLQGSGRSRNSRGMLLWCWGALRSRRWGRSSSLPCWPRASNAWTIFQAIWDYGMRPCWGRVIEKNPWAGLPCMKCRRCSPLWTWSPPGGNDEQGGRVPTGCRLMPLAQEGCTGLVFCRVKRRRPGGDLAP